MKMNRYYALRRKMALLGWTVFFVSCSSTQDVLSPAEENPAGASSAIAEVAPSESASFTRLKSQLEKLGYEGVGLNLENDASLDFLFQVFSDPRSFKRQIQFVYTGLSMDYDKKHKALTIGGTRDIKKVLDFIAKKIPQQ